MLPIFLPTSFLKSPIGIGLLVTAIIIVILAIILPIVLIKPKPIDNKTNI